MALRYGNPPLIEALCELRFVSVDEHKWDWTLPGLLYARLEPRFPKRRERHALELPLVGPQQLATRSIELMQFLSKDESTMVQIAPNLLAVNSTVPHLGWGDLRDTLLEVLKAYAEIGAPTKLEMAAVRYINRVKLPLGPGFALEKYFAVLPTVPHGVPADTTSFLVQTELAFDEPAALFRFRYGTTTSDTSEIATFMLDYEHVGAGTFVPTNEGLETWLDVGHERIERAFYGSFTSVTHTEVFKEIQ